METNNFSDFVLLATFFAIIWYSFETRGLRMATKRSNELSQEPVLIIDYDLRRQKFIIENVGKGVAFNIEVEPIKTKDGTFSFYFDSPYSILKIDGRMDLKIKFEENKGTFWSNVSTEEFIGRIKSECLRKGGNFLGTQFTLNYSSRINKKNNQMKFNFRIEDYEKNPNFKKMYFVQQK